MTVIMSESESNNSNSSDEHSSEEFKGESSLHSGSGKPKLSGNDSGASSCGENLYGAFPRLLRAKIVRGKIEAYFPTVFISIFLYPISHFSIINSSLAVLQRPPIFLSIQSIRKMLLYQKYGNT